MEGAIAGQLIDVQAVEGTRLAKGDVAAIQAQGIDLIAAGEQPVGVIVDRQAVDIFQVSSEQRLVVQ
ncbi:hypothetical protein D3C81_2155920 [compost metagenome]